MKLLGQVWSKLYPMREVPAINRVGRPKDQFKWLVARGLQSSLPDVSGTANSSGVLGPHS